MKFISSLVLVCFSLLLCVPSAAQVPSDPLRLIESLAVAPAVEDGVVVSVTDGDGKPIQGASLIVVTQGMQRGPRTALSLLGMAAGSSSMKIANGEVRRLAAGVTRRDKRFVTDEEGRVAVPRGGSNLAVAVSGRLIGMTRTPIRDEAVEIEVATQNEVAVRVVDVDGRPLRGVPVEMTYNAAWAGGVFNMGWTDRDGMGYALRRPEFEEANDVVGVRVAMFGSAAPSVLLPEAGGDEPVELQMTEGFGRLKVFVEDESLESAGRQIEGVSITLDTGEDDSFSWSAYGAPVVEQDSGFYPCVALGLNLVGWVRFADGSEFRFHGKGPERPGELAVLTATIAKSPQLQAEVVGMTGKPVKSSAVGVLFVNEKSMVGSEMRTDAEGKLRLPIPGRIVSEDLPYELFLMREGFFGSLGSLRVARRAPSDGAPNDLGSLRFDKDPLLVSGRVVDGNGAPVRRARVIVEQTFSRMEYSMSSGHQYLGVKVWTDAEGRFALRKWGSGQVDLKVSKGDLVAGKIPSFAVGATDVEIVLSESFPIRGSIKGAPQGTSISIRPAGPDGWRSNTSAYVGGDGSFTSAGLAPGSYVVTVADGILEFEDVMVGGDAPALDPRLQSLEWKAHVRDLKLKIHAKDGRQPPVGVSVNVVRDPGGEITHYGVGTEVDLALSRAGKATVKVSAVGFQDFSLDETFVGEVADVALVRHPAARVNLGKRLRLPEGVRAFVVETGKDIPNDRRLVFSFEGSHRALACEVRRGQAVFSAEKAGSYSLDVVLTTRDAQEILGRVKLDSPVELGAPDSEVKPITIDGGKALADALVDAGDAAKNR